MKKPAESLPDPANSSHPQPRESTLLPMLIVGLIMVIIGLVVIMAFF